MKTISLLAPWIRRFLLEYLVGDRNLAPNTQRSYRDTLVLFLPFVGKKLGKPIDQLAIEDVCASTARQFLHELEQKRRCSISTRNQRLAAIHVLARFIGKRNPEHIAWLADIRSIPFKKTSKPSMAYLEKHEMDALLNTSNRQYPQGLRDHALLLFLYNSGARASEAAQLTIADLDLGIPPSVTLRGKGGKVRRCPLWPETGIKLAPLITGRDPQAPVFLNRRRQPLTRFGIRALVKRSAQDAGQKLPSLSAKRPSALTPSDTRPPFTCYVPVSISTPSALGWDMSVWIPHTSTPRSILK